MSAHLQQIASTCLAAAVAGTMTFPQIVGTLTEAGFEAYGVDLRAGTATYYLPTGATLTLQGDRPPVAPHASFDTEAVVAAIREAQAGAPGYTYAGFCAKIAQAGCAGYLVSFPGRRVVYIGRTGDTHTEHFPPRV